MLVGRHEERRRLNALVAGARLGQSGVLVVDGEPGIGKTALLGYAVEQAAGFLVLRVTGSEDEADLPFAGLAQLLRPVAAQLDRLPAPQARALSVALALSEGGEVDRFAVAAGVLSLVIEAADRLPVAIVIDDAHLLDRPSTEAVLFMARRLLADPVLVLAAARSHEAPAWTSAGLPGLSVVGLDGPSSSAVARSAAPQELTREQTHRIVTLSGGNPLAIAALAREPEGLALRPGDAPVPVPTVVADAFGRRAAPLAPADLAVLALAAVAGGDLRVVADVCRVAGLDLTALDRAAALGLVTVSPDRVEFSHALVRSSVYATASPADRRRLHALVAEALPGADDDRRAWHLSAAALGPDAAAADGLDGVGRRATDRGAYAVAASAFEQAARLTPDPTRRSERLLAAGEAAWFAGEDARAAPILGAALDHAVSAQGRTRARTLLGLVAGRRGFLGQARDALLAAARDARDTSPDDALFITAEAVDVCFYLLDRSAFAEASALLEDLLAGRTPEGTGRHEVTGTAVATDRPSAVASIALGMARIYAGEPGAERIRAGVAALARLAESDGDGLQSAWGVIGPLFLREEGAGSDLIRRAVEESRRASRLGTLPHLLFHLARYDWSTDRWARAEVGYGEAVTLAREFGQVTELAANLAGMTWLHARQGRAEEARRDGAESLAVSGKEVRVTTVWVALALAELELSLGETNAAVDRLRGLAAFLAEHDVRDADLSAVPELVEALVRGGRADEAREGADAYLLLADRKGQPWSLARAARVRALLLPEADIDGSERHFAEALSWLSATPDAFEEARTRLLHGERLRRARRIAPARLELQRSLDGFERLGARAWADAAAGELAATGLHAHRRGPGPVVELTPRELQIGMLLAAGRTTRETAAALFLSPKTVEYHLRHLYTKLGIGSRAELREQLGEHEPPPRTP
ncbi:MAG: LuxR family transcriptional regulator [Lapillicoccus sp.]